MKTLNQFLDESMGGGVPLTPQELEIQKKMSRLNVRLARKRRKLRKQWMLVREQKEC